LKPQRQSQSLLEYFLPGRKANVPDSLQALQVYVSNFFNQSKILRKVLNQQEGKSGDIPGEFASNSRHKSPEENYQRMA